MSDNEKLSLPLYAVHIDRGNDVITANKPEHEVRVLKVVHGDKAVRVQGEADEDGDFAANADTELARLQRTYRRINAPDPVAIAFPGGSRELVSFGFELGRAASDEAPQAGIRHHAKAKKAAAKTAKPATK